MSTARLLLLSMLIMRCAPCVCGRWAGVVPSLPCLLPPNTHAGTARERSRASSPPTAPSCSMWSSCPSPDPVLAAQGCRRTRNWGVHPARPPTAQAELLALHVIRLAAPGAGRLGLGLLLRAGGGLDSNLSALTLRRGQPAEALLARHEAAGPQVSAMGGQQPPLWPAPPAPSP